MVGQVGVGEVRKMKVGEVLGREREREERSMAEGEVASGEKGGSGQRWRKRSWMMMGLVMVVG